MRSRRRCSSSAAATTRRRRTSLSARSACTTRCSASAPVEFRADLQRDLTRRKFLAGATATGAGIVLAPSSALARRRGTRNVDVAIVGAGLAGLTAARELVRAGHSVCVLEARDRVGGRILNHTVSRGAIAELGGEFIGPTQDRIAALGRSVGVATFKT